MLFQISFDLAGAEAHKLVGFVGTAKAVPFHKAYLGWIFVLKGE